MDTPQKPPSLDDVATQGGESIANSILARVDDFPHRESLLKSWMTHQLESVPTQILWLGMEDEAAAVFVVYKLIHETLSTSPMFFRRFITSLMLAQPGRFSTVFSRETLWSAVARAPGLTVPDAWATPACILRLLEKLNKKGFWRRSDVELLRDAEAISTMLTKITNPGFRSGVEALRRLQMERSTGLTHGNLMLYVPAKLLQYVDHVAELGMSGKLPPLQEMCDKIHEIVRDQLGEGDHRSIPIDVLFTEPEGDSMNCFILVREKVNIAAQMELRRNLLLIRYFLKYAFSAYPIEKLSVRLAFYLDPGTIFKPLADPARLFHDTELVTFEEFWQTITGKPNGVELIFAARDAAAKKLKTSGLMKQIKSHFNRDRKTNLTSPPAQVPAHAGL